MKIFLLALSFLTINLAFSADISPVNPNTAIQSSKFNELIDKINLINNSLILEKDKTTELQGDVLAIESNGPVVAKVRGSALQWVNSAPNLTQINFEIEEWDTKNKMDMGGSYTAPSTGYYSVKSTVWFALNSVSGVTYLSIYINGISKINGQVYANAGDRMGGYVGDDVLLQKDDVVTIWVYQGSGAARQISERTFSIHLIK